MCVCVFVCVCVRVCVCRMHERKTEKESESLKEQRKEKESVGNHSVGASGCFPLVHRRCFCNGKKCASTSVSYSKSSI